MYIEPCCISHQLPDVIKNPVAFFQSNGDWTAQDLISAASSLVPDAHVVMVIPEVDVYLLRKLNTFLVKDWYRSLCLITRDDRSGLMDTVFGANMCKVMYSHDKQIVDSLIALTNFEKYMVIQGPLLTEKDNSYCLYASSCQSIAEVFKQAIETVMARIRVRNIDKTDKQIPEQLLKLNL